MGESMTAPAVSLHDDVVAAFKARGYRESRATICPRVVAGKRCQQWRDAGGHTACLCTIFSALFDHGHMWLDASGRHVMTGEPYGYREPQLAALIAAVEPLGLQVTVSDESPYYQGYTTLITISRRPE